MKYKVGQKVRFTSYPIRMALMYPIGTGPHDTPKCYPSNCGLVGRIIDAWTEEPNSESKTGNRYEVYVPVEFSCFNDDIPEFTTWEENIICEVPEGCHV